MKLPDFKDSADLNALKALMGLRHDEFGDIEPIPMPAAPTQDGRMPPAPDRADRDASSAPAA